MTTPPLKLYRHSLVIAGSLDLSGRNKLAGLFRMRSVRWSRQHEQNFVGTSGTSFCITFLTCKFVHEALFVVQTSGCVYYDHIGIWLMALWKRVKRH